MRLLARLSLFALLLWPVAGQADPLPVEKLYACADDAQWPPFSYRDKNGQMDGFSIALLKRIAAQTAIDIQVDQLPWKRCLAATRNGKDYQIAIDASSSPERQQTFLLSQAYYQLTPYFFYSRLQHPAGIQIQHGQQLSSLGTLCGIAGYNYSNFALGQTPVYTGGRNFDSLIEMTHRRRCALFLGRYEIVAGMARIGRDLLDDPALAYAPIPDAQPEAFYMLISRNIAGAKALQQWLNQAIDALSLSGELQRMRQSYLTRAH